jgi:hypothetical protein
MDMMFNIVGVREATRRELDAGQTTLPAPSLELAKRRRPDIFSVREL